MRIVLFCHSIISDWNHGNAHFLRGVVTELMFRGHRVDVYEPRGGWSLQHLLAEQGRSVLGRFRRAYPYLSSQLYDPDRLDLDAALSRADLVLVHEWNDPALVNRIGEHRRQHGGYRLFFHDTHHRLITDPSAMSAFDLRHYDGVLAFGDVLRDLYARQPAFPQAWTWHEAADVRVFRPRIAEKLDGDLVWIGNWGDAERTRELREFLIEPVRRLGLKARVYGVRYPREAVEELEAAGIEFGGWIPNYKVPEVFARFRVTLHIPRRPYVEALRGIPTIRPFEALACGIPLVSAPWHDSEGLFVSGRDYLSVKDGESMAGTLRDLLEDKEQRVALAASGRRTLLARHTCAHRVDALLEIDRATREPEPRFVRVRNRPVLESLSLAPAPQPFRPGAREA